MVRGLLFVGLLYLDIEHYLAATALLDGPITAPRYAHKSYLDVTVKWYDFRMFD